MQVLECVVADEVVRADGPDARPWDAIIAPDSLKERIRNQALLSLIMRPQMPFAATALHGLITLYGPPGTGKTTLARGLPRELAEFIPGGSVRLIEINPHGLMSAEHGQSQQRVTQLLVEHLPGLADDGMPTVVVLDEVESMAVARSAASLAANPADVHRATDAVLTALDHNARRNPHLLFVATSNFTSGLDEAFLSRSDAAVLVPLPDARALHRIFQQTLKEIAVLHPAIDRLAASQRLHAVARDAEGMDGRRARKAVFEAIALRLETVLDPGKLTDADLALAVRSSLGQASLTEGSTDAAA